jgi:hypothetical protein
MVSNGTLLEYKISWSKNDDAEPIKFKLPPVSPVGAVVT